MKNYFRLANSSKQYRRLKVSIAVSFISVLSICSVASADEDLLNITAPTKLIVSESDSGLRVILPAVNSTCSYAFLEEGLRGIIDCQGKFPTFSKTLPIKSSNYVKQVRIGIHPDKLRIVLDLHKALPASANNSKEKNVFSFGNVATGHLPQKPNLISRAENKVEVTATPTSKPTSSPSPTPTPTSEPTEEPTPRPTRSPVSTPTPKATPTEVATLEPTATPISDPVKKTSDKQAHRSDELPLSLETLQVNFNEGDRLIKDVMITNHSASQRVVTVDCYLEQDNGSDNSSPGTLTPSPRRFTLGSDQKRAIRFILALDEGSLRVDHEISFVARFSDEYGEMLAPKISFTYLPKQLLPRLISTPVNGKLKLTNFGNAGVELSSGKCCRIDECQPVNLTHLAAGKSVVLDVAEDCQLEFVREFKGSFQKFKVGKEIINDASR